MTQTATTLVSPKPLAGMEYQPHCLESDVRSNGYFDFRTAAQRYSKGRPYLHPQAIRHIQRHLSLTEPVPRALDVACGTGLSTIALKPVAQEIVGADISEEMIRLAPVDPQIRYVVTACEALPFPDAHFDLVTVCAAFHWLDATTFLQEAWRVLHVGGRLVIYEHAFAGKMEGNPAFHSWLKHVYQKMYPMPPRPRRPMPQTVEEAGFRSLGEERPETSLSFSLDRVIDYLVSQSNVIAAVEGGEKSIEQVRDWLTENIRPLFRGAKERTFVFGGPIWYFMKSYDPHLTLHGPSDYKST